MRRSMLIIGGLALAAFVIAYSLLHSYLQPATLVVARYDLAAGTRLSEELIQLREVPGVALPPDALGSVAEAEGQVLTVARAAGDPITSYLVGEGQTSAGLPSLLAPGTVAIGVQVDQATGLIGTVRPGQTVSAIAILDPQAIALSLGLSASAAGPPASAAVGLADGEAIVDPQPTPQPTATPQPPLSPISYVSITGLKVLVVPQSFRYEEVPEIQGEEALFSNARTTLAGQNDSVILLQAPLAPLHLADGLEVSPAVLLALLNQVATVHLALEPAEGLAPSVLSDLPSVALAELFEAVSGYDLGQ